jgi:hypothetical protein
MPGFFDSKMQMGHDSYALDGHDNVIATPLFWTAQLTMKTLRKEEP